MVRAMVRACGWAAEAPRVQEFAWPLHQNPQLDRSATAAAAALQAFLARLVGEAGLGRILLLGSSARELAGQNKELKNYAQIMATSHVWVFIGLVRSSTKQMWLSMEVDWLYLFKHARVHTRKAHVPRDAHAHPHECTRAG